MQFNTYVVIALLLVTINSLHATVMQMDEFYHPEHHHVKKLIILTPLEIKALNSLIARQLRMIAIFDTYFTNNLVKEVQKLIQELKLESQKLDHLISISDSYGGLSYD